MVQERVNHINVKVFLELHRNVKLNYATKLAYTEILEGTSSISYHQNQYD